MNRNSLGLKQTNIKMSSPLKGARSSRRPSIAFIRMQSISASTYQTWYSVHGLLQNKPITINPARKSSTSGGCLIGATAPIPPVLGPLSPSRSLLWSIAKGIFLMVWPSVKQSAWNKVDASKNKTKNYGGFTIGIPLLLIAKTPALGFSIFKTHL